ncbi:MAG: HAMP domain-containing sensor histidine kinase [Gordonia sp. (in: high G+C Gram-positive bacteria)]|uniref:sensor histidine kinase n=1 Tax=Gordonia sp. (in: high G+C Gram-positive bacteria) TaxID=84139 RepID=UPI003BB55D79
MATALVTVALAIAAGLILLILHSVLTASADDAVRARAAQLSTALRTEPVSELDPSMLTTTGDVDIIQLLGADGGVLHSTHPAPALTGALAPGQQSAHDDVEVPSADGDADYRVFAEGVRTPSGDVTVVVATATAPIHRTLAVVAVLCCIAFPIIVGAMAFLTYQLVGRTLAPIDSMRARVESISGGDLSQRLPVPETHDEVADLAVTMNAMLGRAESARLQQTQFINDASHELNSPLTSIVGLLDLAAATDQPIDLDTVRTFLLPEALTLQQRIDDLLFLARADERGVPLRTEVVDLGALVGAAAEHLRTSTDLSVDALLIPALVVGDPRQLTRALRNLTDNAAGHATSRIVLSMRANDDAKQVSVRVADDGPGIPVADRTRVFDRFVRLDAARAHRTGGSGLGLPIVAEIARAHDGTVSVIDGDTRGATLALTLPMLDPNQPPSSASR